jgi:hypothetical protein
MRVWPVATAGRLGAYAIDPSSGTFAMAASATAPGRRGEPSSDTEIYVPSDVHGAVRVSGAATLDAVVSRPDDSRLVYVRTTAGGGAAYGVTVGAPSSRLRALVTAEAAHPLPPIDEPTARAMALSALNAEAHSPNKSVAAGAQLVQGLADVVLGSSDPNVAPAG